MEDKLKRIYCRLVAIWYLVKGQQYILFAIHHHGDKTTGTMTSNVPNTATSLALINAAIPRLNMLKTHIEERIKN